MTDASAPPVATAATIPPAVGPSEKRRKPRANPGPSGPRKRKEPETTSDTIETGKNLTLGQWLEIFDFCESHSAMTQKQVEAHFRAKGYKVTQSMLSRKLKDKEALRARALTTANALSSKRPRVVQCPEVERALLLWFQGMEARGEVVSGAMLVEKRARFEKEFGIPSEQRTTSDGWVKSFKNAYGIKEHRRHGEAGSVDPEAAEKERERLRPILAQYKPEDRFNGDEAALFAYAPPDRGLSTKAMSGKKAQKFRITLLFVCNSTGTEKEPLMYIGKYGKPRCFKHIPAEQKKKFYYRYNTKAWMNSHLFEEYIKQFDRKMRAQGRKVLMLLDNFSGHSIAYEPTNVRIEPLAPNMTSRIQPLDAGIIRAFKAHYRRAFCMRALNADDAGEEDIWKLNLWEAMVMARNAWDEISARTISNCWAHTGILPLSPPAPAANASSSASAPSPNASTSSDPDSAAWAFLSNFVSDNTMTLPEAQSALTKLLGAAAEEPTWQKALGIANDVEPNDDDAQAAARKALDTLRETSNPSGRMRTAALAPVTSSAHIPEETIVERDLGLKLKQLAERKLVRNPLTLNEFLDLPDEQQVGEGVHEMETDEQIIAAVRTEYAAKASAAAGPPDDQADEESDDDEDPAVNLPIDEIISLCTKLETACTARGVDNAFQLRSELLKVKRELRQTQLKTAKQVSIQSFLARPSQTMGGTDAMDVDSNVACGSERPIIVD